MPSLTVCIPHKHTRHNDAALLVALSCIVDNTRCDYELLIDTTTPTGVYGVYNRMARQAASEWVVFTNSDVFFAPGWDTPMLEAAGKYKIITGVLVECGAIGVSDRNIMANFGRTPQTFERSAFEEMAAGIIFDKRTPPGEGWFMPCLMHRDTFLAMGAFDTRQGDFPTPLDGLFWEKWKASGLTVQRVRSYAYHLQNFSDEERTKEARIHG